MADSSLITSANLSHKMCTLITGASSDIGCELIRQLASPDMLILAHHNQSLAKLHTLREGIPELALIPIQADFSLDDDVQRLVSTIQNSCQAPEHIVHLTAPRVEYHRFKESSWEFFQNELDIQLRSIIRILQAFLPLMAKNKKGKVVFVLSSYTLNIPPGALSHYVTAKFALLGLARCLAAEYSAKHININSVSPSMVETAFLQNIPERMVEIAASQSPWQRNATPQDVAGVIRFLLSSQADYLTGVNIPISGGTAF
jgi:3-oxoacyl-[acyl-carrier protein] reductase